MKNIETFDKFVNEGANYKQIEKMMLGLDDEFERFVNDIILDTIFTKYPDASVADIKKAAIMMVDETIDTWEQTADDR